jgi:hypothetical protein
MPPVSIALITAMAAVAAAHGTQLARLAGRRAAGWSSWSPAVISRISPRSSSWS